MATLALTVDGLLTQSQQEIRDEIVEQLRSTFGPNTNVSADTLLGQVVNIVSEFRAVDQQVLGSVYRSFDPNSAIGAALDRLCTLTGTIRKDATSSVVEGLLEFSGAAVVNDGDLINNDDNDTNWEAINGPYSDTGGPYPEFVAAQFQAVDTGPISAQAGTTWSLVTVIANLDGFTNPSDDADLGRNQETDLALRQRRQTELFAQGQGPLATISGAVSRVDGVEIVRTYHNPATNPVDADGIPWKAFNVVVRTDPDPPTAAMQQAIWDAIWVALGGGGQAYGTGFVGNTVDSEGQSHPIAFDTVTDVDVWIRLTLTTSTSEEAITPNLNAIVEDALLESALANDQTVGRDVQAWDYVGVVYDLRQSGEVSGVDGVLAEVSFDGVIWVTTKLSIGIREIAAFDSPRISVTQV